MSGVLNLVHEAAVRSISPHAVADARRIAPAGSNTSRNRSPSATAWAVTSACALAASALRVLSATPTKIAAPRTATSSAAAPSPAVTSAWLRLLWLLLPRGESPSPRRPNERAAPMGGVKPSTHRSSAACTAERKVAPLSLLRHKRSAESPFLPRKRGSERKCQLRNHVTTLQPHHVIASDVGVPETLVETLQYWGIIRAARAVIVDATLRGYTYASSFVKRCGTSLCVDGACAWACGLSICCTCIGTPQR
jgi:hypothetical protein